MGSVWINNIQLYNVAPTIPGELEFIETLSRNLWWCWNHDAIELFRRIDLVLWRTVAHNPIQFLNEIPQKRLEELTEDDGFLSHLDQVKERFEAEVLHSVNGDAEARRSNCIAYFSLEFGVHESVRLYAGGLGCLAGDHLKSASDMDLPLVGVGLFYRQGYFRQYLNEQGLQQESFLENEIHRLPVKPAFGAGNVPLQVSIPLPEGQLRASVWRMDVGRIALFLLDSNIVENPPELRGITARLYDADRRTRLCQELLLGLGGFRAIVALGYNPSVCHMNEGHAAFASFGRIEHLTKNQGIALDEALQIVSRTNVFTTHTPVPAGHEYFSVDMARPHFAALQKEIGIPQDQMISWGHSAGDGKQHEVCMTVLGLRMAQFSNGVSKLHGHVERKMWGQLWPERPEDEIPIRHITNGIHIASWVSGDNVRIFDKYLGPEWRDNPADHGVLSRVARIPDEELWKAHELGRSRLVRTAREIAERQFAARSATHAEISQMKSALHSDALTIGFARRFASYKRASLILKNLDRLAAILTDKERPAQIIFAGKAHPADGAGKDLIRQIVELAGKANVRQKIVFLEDYDIRMARYLVQGVDVWLNTPRRPQEASGTSGMKAGVNGILNLSILDGWWDEGYSPEAGWAIGGGEEYENTEYQDSVESQALYNLLENEIVPLFYDRKDGDIPRGWTKMMKAAIRTVMARFTSHRMLSEYATMFYGPAMREHGALLADDMKRARALVRQHERLASLWKHVKIARPRPEQDMSALHVGAHYKVSTEAHLGELRPDEVDMEVYYALVDTENRPFESQSKKMDVAEDMGGGKYRYRCEIACDRTGRYGFTARVMPQGQDWRSVMPGFITWSGIES